VGPRRAPDPQGQLGKPTEFGYVDQLCETTPNTKQGARGFILPPTSQIGNPAKDTLPPDTAQQLRNLDINLKEIIVDGAFTTTATHQALKGLTDTVHIAGRQQPESRRTATADSATAPACRDESATSNAAMGCADRA
jgi:hypothetical protein